MLAAGFTVIMFLLFIEVMHSLMTRIELGENSVKMTLPAGRGPTPVVRYRSHDIPYDQIKAVETRREIYGGSMAPVLLQGARLVLKDDSAVKLGYVSEANSDPCFPYPEIAQKIAERAGLQVEHKGNVRRSLQKKYFGLKKEFLAEAAGDVPEAEIEALNKSHRKWVMRHHQPAGRPRRCRHRARHRLPAEQRPAAGADQHHEVDHVSDDLAAGGDGAGQEEVSQLS